MKARLSHFLPVRSRIPDFLFGLAFGLVFVASLGPLAAFAAGPRYWPGFFYAPFYTTNVFTDATTPAARAGLRPEDRVVGVNRERIERLGAEVEKQGPDGGSLALVYELGRELTAVRVPVEPLGWERILEKWGPLVLSGLALAWLGRRRKSAGLIGLALLAATDYWLNPGAGRESGFNPAAWWESGQPGLVTAKWSAYLYWPLWTLAWASTASFICYRLWPGRPAKLVSALWWTLAASELGAYGYAAWKSAAYNNPDYIIWHARAVFWPGWGALVGLAGIWALKGRQNLNRWAGWVGLLAGVGGFGALTVFDWSLAGPGPQWYTLGLVIFGYKLLQ